MPYTIDARNGEMLMFLRSLVERPSSPNVLPSCPHLASNTSRSRCVVICLFPFLASPSVHFIWLHYDSTTPAVWKTYGAS